ncbi:MAG: Threonine synthase [Burkholderia sp.]|jgi:threonine synthase
MKYISTRGSTEGRSFTDIAFEGYAPDNGLYVPDEFPKVDLETLKTWRGLPYPMLAFEIMRLFAPELPKDMLWRVCSEAFQPRNFPYSHNEFIDDEITPITWLHDDVGLFELSTGRTLSWDDLSMRFLGSYYDKFCAGGEPMTLLGATTGDMGCSAEAVFGGKPGVKVVMLSPRDRMSAFQQKQLYTSRAENVYNLAVNGTFDECQDIVRAILQDREFAAKHHLHAINSIIWSRVAAEVIYDFYGYLRAVTNVGEEIAFAMPCGNFGNAYACMVARRMGLPVARLIVCTNENDTMNAFLRTGHYRPRPSSETIKTSSPSTDISRAASFERFLFEVLNRDALRVRQLMGELESKGEFRLTPKEIELLRKSGVVSGASSHANRLEMIETLWVNRRIFIDPHTADALFSGEYLHPVGMKTLCLETVRAAKFPRMVKLATGCDITPPSEFLGLDERPERRIDLEPDEQAVRAEIERAEAANAA